MKTVIWQLIGKEGNPNTFQLTLKTNKDESVKEIVRQLEKSFKDIEDILEAKIVVVKGWAMENKVVPISNQDRQNRKREEQIEKWLLGQAKESGLFKEEDKPDIPIIEINLTPKQNNNKK